MTIDIGSLTVRQLQTESARVLASSGGLGNHELVRFNKLANHDSHEWYKAVIKWYVEKHGDLPSQVGPGTSVRLLLDNGN